jgi:hypothetical protein
MSLVALRRHSKLIAALMIASLIDFGCASFSRVQLISPRGNTYRYVYEMVEPVESPDLQYKNPKFNMWFTVDQGAVSFDARNLSSSKMVILGGNASMGINGKFFPVRTSSTYYADSTSFLLTTPVPAGGYVQDFFIPRNNIFYDGNKWVERDLLPTMDYNNPVRRLAIQKNIGAEIHLIVPIKIGNELQEYTFRFKIAGVKVVNPDSVVQHEPRLPPPPTPKRPPTKTEFWVSIGIVSSVTLATLLIVTREHPFPSGL